MPDAQTLPAILSRLLGYLLHRLALAAVALVAVAAIVYAMFDFPHGLERVFFHLDFGVTCSYPGCPAVTVLWGRTWHTDVYLVLGAVVLGVTAGLAGAVFCATRPRSFATRAVETLALIFYSLPVYLFGFGLLLLFEPTFGLLPSPVFFHPQDYAAPLENPWRFFEAMLVPWILVAAPFGAVVMRLAQAAILEEIDSDYVRTASAKGLAQRQVMRRAAARPGYVSVAALIGMWVPTFVTNMVLVPHEPLGHIDIPMVQALALWGGLLIVLVSALADVVLVMLDPRVRASGRPVG